MTGGAGFVLVAVIVIPCMISGSRYLEPASLSSPKTRRDELSWDLISCATL